MPLSAERAGGGNVALKRRRSGFDPKTLAGTANH